MRVRLVEPGDSDALIPSMDVLRGFEVALPLYRDSYQLTTTMRVKVGDLIDMGLITAIDGEMVLYNEHRRRHGVITPTGDDDDVG